MRDDLVDTVRRCLHYAGPIDGQSDITLLVRDSMDLVELISVVSDRYRIRFDLFEMDHVRTLDDLIAYVETRVAEPATDDPLDRF